MRLTGFQHFWPLTLYTSYNFWLPGTSGCNYFKKPLLNIQWFIGKLIRNFLCHFLNPIPRSGHMMLEIQKKVTVLFWGTILIGRILVFCIASVNCLSVILQNISYVHHHWWPHRGVQIFLEQLCPLRLTSNYQQKNNTKKSEYQQMYCFCVMYYA